MRERRISYEEAVLIVKRERRCIWPNAGFVEQLDLWAYLDYDIHDRDEGGVVVDTKELYDESRVSWEIVERRRTAEKAHRQVSTAITTTTMSVHW